MRWSGAARPAAAVTGWSAVLAAAWSLRLGLHIAAPHRVTGRGRALRAVPPRMGRGVPAPHVLVPADPGGGGGAAGAVDAAGGAQSARRWACGDVAAPAVLAVAIVGEALADAQLRRFRADPANRGSVCDVGLWGWSRHPNYFFEWLGWVAYPLIAIDRPA